MKLLTLAVAGVLASGGIGFAAGGYTVTRDFHGVVTNGGIQCMTVKAGVVDSRTGRPIQSGFLCGRTNLRAPAPTVDFRPHRLTVTDHNGTVVLVRTYP